MIAAYSSAVPLRRLLEAIRGTSLAMWICAKWPSGVKTRMPFGVSPNGNDFAPSGAVISATTKVQVPTSWSRRLCCATVLPGESASTSAAAAVCKSFMMSSGKRVRMLLRMRSARHHPRAQPCADATPHPFQDFPYQRECQHEARDDEVTRHADRPQLELQLTTRIDRGGGAADQVSAGIEPGIDQGRVVPPHDGENHVGKH